MKNRTHIRAGCALLVFACGVVLFAQDRPGSVEGKRDELSDLRASIRESEERLKGLESRARKSAAAATESRVQAAALDSLMGLLKEREGHIAEEMIAVRSRRDSLGELARQIADEYTTVARFLYRRRLLAPAASMLLMPEEHRKLALSERLFARYAVRQKERAGTIVALRDSLGIKDSLLALRREQQLALLSDQREQMRKLQSLQNRYAKELRRAESEKGTLEELLRRKNAEAKQIEGMIARLVAQAETRSSAKGKSTQPSEVPAARSGTPSKTKASDKGKKSTSVTTDAEKKKSAKENGTATASASAERSSSKGKSERAAAFKPTWPVSGRTILQGYGERTNPRTKTVTFNPGINIAAKSGTRVNASAAGEVSLVSWLPGYGTVVIIEHSGGWRTVYANLASADVSEGTTVSRGKRIGTVGASDDGEYLHFEIWRNQTRHNPTTLLK